MNQDDPIFLTKNQVDALHEYQLKAHGGQPGVRDINLVESAVAQPQHVYNYGRGDHFDVAAAYAYHISENQPYLDGNKRTGVQAAVLYMQANGIETQSLPEDKTYQLMIDVANKTASRYDIAQHFRSTLSQEQIITVQQQSISTPPESELTLVRKSLSDYKPEPPEPTKPGASQVPPSPQKEPEPAATQVRNPYQLSSPEPERKQGQSTNPYKLPGIDDDTGHHH